ncbi:hypothetical protein [Trabulsiella odontotermitis]|nr:hypothetical protein [Trabulsiella odontotermitis]
MSLLIRCMLSALILMLMAIPAVSDSIALAIESRFHFLLLFL